jgi:flagellin
MGMQVNTNLAANNAYRNLNNNQTALNKSLEKLSSGLRINRAGDDAAGLAISEGLKSQVGGLTVASRNAQDGINVVQTAEGGLSQTQAILQRLRDLAVQAGNDSNNSDSRAAITTESKGLVEELGRISDTTNFAKTNLLNGDHQSLTFQVGANGDKASQISVDLSGANVKSISAALTSGGSSVTSASFDVADVAALAGPATFTSTKNGVETKVTTADLGSAGDFDSVEGYATALRGDAAFSANFSVSVQKDANGAGTGIVVTALDGGTVSSGTGTEPGTGVDVGAPGTAVPKGLDFSSAASSQKAINLIDTQINNVSTARASLGATQNRLESAVQTISISKENLSASQSRITDTDMAEEMVSYTRSSILSQAGTAMLAQANQSNQGVLSLLR